MGTSSEKSGFDALGFASGYRAPQVMAREHQHQDFEINYLPSGTLTYLAGGRRIPLPSQSFSVFWAAAPHQVISVESAPRFYWFTMPFAWVLQWKLPKEFVEALIQGRFLIAKKEKSYDDGAACARWHSDILSVEPARLQAAQLEIEARLRRLAGRPRSNIDSRRLHSSGHAEPVQKMVEFIARHYTEPLSIAEIVRAAGLHPNYGMSLFRSTCGVSILEYLNQQKIFHAKRLLVTTDLKIIDVAMESGFGSLSRFHEVFLKAGGCTPRQFRLQMTSELPRESKGCSIPFRRL